MPSTSLADVRQKDWIRACRKLGLVVMLDRGKGGHILVKHPSSGAKCTVQHDLHKIINIKIFNTLRNWGLEEEVIYEALR